MGFHVRKLGEHARELGGKTRTLMHGARSKLVKWTTPEDRTKWSLIEIFKHIWTLKGIIIIVLAFLLPLDLVATVGGWNLARSKCAYVIAVMAILWLTEAIPIPVTALIPIFMLPMLQVADAKKVSASYITDTSMLFLGGLILAVAVEEWNLHRRVAISVMRVIGAHPSMLMLGLMIPTWFLSMWISNTAATSMMIPIIQAVVDTMEEVHLATYANRGTRNPAFERSESSAYDSNLSVSGSSTNASVSTNGAYGRNGRPIPGREVVSMVPLGRDPTRGKGGGGSSSSLSSTNETDITSVSAVRASSSKETIPSSASSTRPILPSQQQGATSSSERSLATVGRSSAASSQANLVNNEEHSNESLSAGARELHRLAKSLALAVAFAANIGGIATLTGTPPNLVLKGMADGLYANKSGDRSMESPITFASWMGFAFPLSLITLVLAWLWLLLYFTHGKCFKTQDTDTKEAVNRVIRRQFKDLGFITFAEGVIITIFVVLVIMWLFREPPSFDGWGAAFYDSKSNNKYVSDSTPVILLTLSFFFLPATKPSIFCWAENRDSPSFTPILTWNVVEKKVCWGVIILLGGGFAIANASEESGLSNWLGDALKSSVGDNEPWITNFIFAIIASMATEVTSNTAMATLFLPVMASVGLSTGIHPLYLMVSACVASSFAFMLPVATPPNAIVFSTGYITIFDMAITGLPMSLFAVFILIIAINTWGRPCFSLDDIPDFFKTNGTG